MRVSFHRSLCDFIEPRMKSQIGNACPQQDRRPREKNYIEAPVAGSMAENRSRKKSEADTHSYGNLYSFKVPQSQET